MNKILILIVTIFGCFFSSCGLALRNEKLPDDDRKIRYVLGQTKKILEKRYQVKCTGFGIGAMTEVKILALSFEVNRKLTKEEARAMLIDSAKVMIQIVANCPEIQPHLQKEGFSEKNVDIAFFIRDKGKKTFDPDFCEVGFYKGQLAYKTNNPEHPIYYKNKEYETYEEALALLEESAYSKSITNEKKTIDFSADRDIAKMLKL